MRLDWQPANEREELVRSMVPFVIAAANRLHGVNGAEFDDLLHDGLVGLLRAADTYDSTRGTFCTWGGWHARGEMQNRLRQSPIVRELSYPNGRGHAVRVKAVSCIGTEDLSRSQEPSSVNRELERVEAEIDARRITGQIPRRLAYIIRRSSEGATLETISSEIGLSRERVRQLRNLGLSRALVVARRRGRDRAVADDP